MAKTMPDWQPVRGALWLTLSAGSAWIVYGLILCAATRKPVLDLAEAALIAMAVGEGVLVTGAAVDWAMANSGALYHVDPVWLNAGIVAISNVAMAASITRILARMGVEIWKSIALWFLGLDAVGVITFMIFYRLLLGGKA
jgi:hypothetical protein